MFGVRQLSVALLLCMSQVASSFTTPSYFGGVQRLGLARQQQRTVHPPTMMAKKVSKIIKLALQAGKANPAPPVGPALGAAGVNIMMFCKEYNAKTQDQVGTVIPVEISVYEDKSFTFIMKTPPASELIKKYAKISKGSGTPGGRGYVKAGSLTMADVEEIAKIKMPDLNTQKLQSAMNTVMGTAKNMGVTVEA